MDPSFEMSGFDEFERELNRLSENAQAIDGEHLVPLHDLFLQARRAGSLHARRGERVHRFAAIPDAEWDAFIPAYEELFEASGFTVATPVLRALVHTLVARVAPCLRLVTMQQHARLRHVRRVGGRRRQAVRQTRFGVHPDMRLHPEVPLVSLLRLVHLRIVLPCGSSSTTARQ